MRKQATCRKCLKGLCIWLFYREKPLHVLQIMFVTRAIVTLSVLEVKSQKYLLSCEICHVITDENCLADHFTVIGYTRE